MIMTARVFCFLIPILDSSRPGLPAGGRNINGYSRSWELFNMQSRKVLVGDLRRETRWKFASQVFPSTTARVGLCCPRVVATICRKKKVGRSLLCERFGWWCGLKDLKHPLDIMAQKYASTQVPTWTLNLILREFVGIGWFPHDSFFLRKQYLLKFFLITF